MQEFCLQIAREAVLYHTGKEMTQDQEFATRYHTYGIMGMFIEWLFGDTMTTEYLTSSLFDRTPDFLSRTTDPIPYEHKAFKLPEPVKHYCEECEYFLWGLRTAQRLEDGTCNRFTKPEHIYHRKESCPRYEPKRTAHKRDKKAGGSHRKDKVRNLKEGLRQGTEANEARAEDLRFPKEEP